MAAALRVLLLAGVLLLGGCAGRYFQDAGAPPAEAPRLTLADWPSPEIWTGVIFNGEKIGLGEVRVSGAKNAALPIMAATLLAPGVHHLSNVPPLADIRTFKKVLGLMGVQFEEGGPGGRPHQEALVADTSRLTGWMAPYEVVKTMRAAVLVPGPLVARARQASVSLPGGCAIGARPIDQHLKGLEAMGVKITLNQGYVEAKAKRLHGAEITLEIPTVTGTENLMMAATLAEGTTRILNAAQEPEVTDLANFLVAMGARIEGFGTDALTIHGVAPPRRARRAPPAPRSGR